MMSWALIENGRVINLTAWADGTTASDITANFPQYIGVEITPGLACRIGDYYNSADGLFYVDAEFTHLSGWVPPPDVSVVYNQMIENIISNGQWLINSSAPYSSLDASVWAYQYQEAKLWKEDNSYVPTLLNAMISVSGTGVLSEITDDIISRTESWKALAGGILGQVKLKNIELDALMAEVNTGNKTVYDVMDFDSSITIPTPSGS